MVRNLENSQIDFSFLPRNRSNHNKTLEVLFLNIHSSVIIPKKGLKIKSFDDLYSIRIGVVRGAKNADRFDMDDDLFRYSFRNLEILVKMLDKKRLDAIVGNNISISYLFYKNNIQNSDLDVFVLEDIPIWLQFSKESAHQDKIPKIKEAIEELIKLGELSRLTLKYENLFN